MKNKKLANYLIKKGHIPLDKSWIIRMGILDLLNGYETTIKFLEQQKELGDDLRALYNASLDWNRDKPVYVGESATLYRFLKFASWKLGLKKKFVLQGTLKKRKICDNAKIINYPLEKLLELDNKTSQWASASVLLGNEEKIKNPPYKLKITYEAVEHWKKQRKKGRAWQPRYDETILAQATAFLDLLGKGKTTFIPKQPEEYCFARAFNLITKEQGEKNWPSLRSHESNRIKEMEKALNYADERKEICSKDHRVVQAIAMYIKSKNRDIKIKYSSCVSKSWPQFWKFLNDSSNIIKNFYKK